MKRVIIKRKERAGDKFPVYDFIGDTDKGIWYYGNEFKCRAFFIEHAGGIVWLPVFSCSSNKQIAWPHLKRRDTFVALYYTERDTLWTM